MNSNTLKYRNQLQKAIEIQHQIMADSKNFDDTIKSSFSNFEETLKQMLQEKNTLTQIKSLAKDFLIFWNESIGIEVELFWTEIKQNKIEFERKDELQFVLEKTRFRRVDQAMAARKSWEGLKDLTQIKSRFKQDEIEQISKIIKQDETKRIDLLKKCLSKNTIPQSQYLKFGESIVYMQHCNLIETYFNENEINLLYSIWNNFN